MRSAITVPPTPGLIYQELYLGASSHREYFVKVLLVRSG
jgi:hypothetical protein